MTKQKYFLLILLLGSLTALGPFSIDMYLPGFPAIAKDLNTTVLRVSLSLSSFFIGISAGQLLYGPLLDRFGRKKPLYVGLSVYILASAGCVFATSLDALIALRFMQAIGSCAAAVASIAMVRDLFPVKENAKVFALLMLVVSVSPMVAPTIGGYVTVALGWHTVFIILMALGLLNLIASWLWLPDSYQPDTSLSLKPIPIIKNFLSVVKEPQFYTYAFTGAFAFSGLFAYISGSPLVFIDIFKVSEEGYGWIFALLSVGLIGSSQVNTLMLRKYKSEQLILAALSSQLVIVLFFLFGSINHWFGLVETIILLFLFLCCLGFTNPNTSALSLAPFSRNAGSASALMGAVQMGLGALASFGVSMFDLKSAVPMVTIMTGATIVALLILLIGRRNIKVQVQADKDSGMVIH
ncbi:MFS transporter, DHA1 family, bicyclomycin/chloramphenicol resistance protein [Pedobacter steynii]|uniref:MFS transporter, DHA1 family, bicyclomycin/chloramphenicol resistance protein n=1 Tax=Pedobacter steynii TaxID=430522 RepID=A0A1G9KIE3_9SPHI|nr:multidrug effflux MFS transporter [Pedobacter steynii]NQX38553.1 multidrug effflux MFS transporter [Pedobacter steynii]SDL49163.1 MFS transporter, DHA1 family, bicyclomycin/chloramphenicol resistance protein [Pedobacter steynii]